MMGLLGLLVTVGSFAPFLERLSREFGTGAQRIATVAYFLADTRAAVRSVGDRPLSSLGPGDEPETP